MARRGRTRGDSPTAVPVAEGEGVAEAVAVAEEEGEGEVARWWSWAPLSWSAPPWWWAGRSSRTRPRWDERRGARVECAPADPVLDLAYSPGVLAQLRQRKEALVDGEQAVEGNRVGAGQRVHGPRHGVDVADDLFSGDVDVRFTGRERHLGPEKPPAADHEALDVRGRHGLGAQEEPGERFGIYERLGRVVQVGDRSLRVGDIGDITVESKEPARKRVGDVGFVLAPLPVRSGLREVCAGV